jgi:hypothetical protein
MDPRASDRAGAAAEGAYSTSAEGLLARMAFDLTPYHPLVMSGYL